MLRNKSKQYLLALLKVTLVITCFGFIYYRIRANNSLSPETLTGLFSGSSPADITILPWILLLSLLNWGLEIQKWKILAGSIRNISFAESCRQVLAAQTLSLFTPMKLGEYGAKAFFYTRQHFKRVVLLNFAGSLSQLAPTLFFGSIGLWFFISERYPELLTVYAALLVTGLIFLPVRRYFKNTIRSGKFGFSKFAFVAAAIRRRKMEKVVFIAFLRYLVFSLQFYFLLNWFTPVSLTAVLPGIFTMYLLSSALPVLQLFDVLIKGSIAVFVFAAFNELTIITVIALMWLFNTVLPAVAGSYFVLSLNTKTLAVAK